MFPGKVDSEITIATYLPNPFYCVQLRVVPREQQAICPSAGFFRDAADCTRFHRCVDLFGMGFYSIYFFACPQGTVFDEVGPVSIDMCASLGYTLTGSYLKVCVAEKHELTFVVSGHSQF